MSNGGDLYAGAVEGSGGPLEAMTWVLGLIASIMVACSCR